MIHEEHLTASEAGKILGVTDARIRQLCGEGRIQGKKFGKSWVISRSEVERFKAIPRGPGVRVEEN